MQRHAVPRRPAAAVLCGLLLLLLSFATAGAARADCGTLRALPDAPTRPSRPLTFGIYPGGPVGTVSGGESATRPVDPSARLAALQALKPADAPFAVHLYTPYSGDADADAVAPGIAPEVADDTAAGIEVGIVLTYRPADRDARADVPGYVDFVRQVVRRVARNRLVTALQITNEANIDDQPAASDGDFPGVRDALVRGVVAAARERDRLRARHLRIGFNWAYQPDVAAARRFFADLDDRGGRRFRHAVDWVGIDVYPGTWSPLSPRFDPSTTDRASIVEALRTLRLCAMPAGGLDASIPIHVTENGYPTGDGRTEDDQVRALEAQVTAVDDFRARYGVTNYDWFDLRDADSTGEMESQYGLLRDDYSPKPAFWVYRDLVAARSADRRRRR